MTFESQHFNKEQVSSSFIEAAYERAISGRGQDEIKMESFIEDYGEAVVSSDQELAQTLAKKFEGRESFEEREMHKLATILEAIVIEQIELSEWLGPTTMTRRTSLYDDYINGVDAIAEIEQENTTSHLALAIDVTYGNALYQKFERIREEIEAGTLTTIKYFEDSDRTFKGKLFKVPRIVLGVDKRALVELAELWMQGKKRELGLHRVQIKLIEEVRIQLKAFREYAASLEGREDIVKIFDRQIRILGTIKKERYEALEELGVVIEESFDEGSDKTFDAIRHGARDIASRAG